VNTDAATGLTNKTLLSLYLPFASTSFAWPDDVTELNVSDDIAWSFLTGHYSS
jgi:hypothetical protein